MIKVGLALWTLFYLVVGTKDSPCIEGVEIVRALLFHYHWEERLTCKNLHYDVPSLTFARCATTKAMRKMPGWYV